MLFSVIFFMIKRLTGLFACGSAGYAAIEVLWRGYTHWTMALTGGAVFTAMASVHKRLHDVGLPRRCMAGAALITTAEFIVGCVVNRRYGLGVWDYSKERFNIKGQICAKYAALWFALSAPAMGLAGAISRTLSKPPKTSRKRLAPGDARAYNWHR